MSANPSELPASIPLRLFQPAGGADSPPTDPASWKLRACYLAHKAPTLAAPERARTAAEYSKALDHWESRTCDPPIGEVTDDTLLAFQRELTVSGLANSTVNKTLRHIRGIFQILGPRAHRNPSGKNILPFAPYVEPVAEDCPEKRVASTQHLSAIYRACAVATWPRSRFTGVEPPIWWRALLVFETNFGLRTRDLRARQRRDIQPGDSNVPGRSRPELRYLRWVPPKTRRRKPQPLYLPLNAVCELHLRHLTPHNELLFPAPRNDDGFYHEWKAIQAAAGIDDPYMVKEIRVTCNSRADRQKHGSGRLILGHAKRDVNSEYYLQSEDHIYDVLMNLEQPEAFLRGPLEDVTRQLVLF